MNARIYRAVSPLFCLVFPLLTMGCGSTYEDPFQRAEVYGSVSLDGNPVKFGSIQFRGERNAETQELAQTNVPVRNGEFNSEDSGRKGTSLGNNEVTLQIFSSDPEDEEVEAQVTGTWQGEVVVADDNPIEIAITAEELETQRVD